MINHETSLSPSGAISYTYGAEITSISCHNEVDHITNNLKNLLEKLDNIKIEASSSHSDRNCNMRSTHSCQSFVQKINQATNDFQEFTKTDQLIRVPSIEQPNQTSFIKSEDNDTVEGGLTVSITIGEEILFFEENLEEDYENLFKGLSPIASSLHGDDTFSRDCYYLEDPSFIIQEDHQDENRIVVDTISMSSSHIDLVEVDKESHQSTGDNDLSTNLSIEFDIQENHGENDTDEEDGMILKFLDKEQDNKKTQEVCPTIDLGSNVDLNDK